MSVALVTFAIDAELALIASEFRVGTALVILSWDTLSVAFHVAVALVMTEFFKVMVTATVLSPPGVEKVTVLPVKLPFTSAAGAGAGAVVGEGAGVGVLLGAGVGVPTLSSSEPSVSVWCFLALCDFLAWSLLPALWWALLA